MRNNPGFSILAKRAGRALVVAVFGGVAFQAAALESMTDGDMAAATGQEGIGLQMELRINSDQFGQALTASNPGDRGMLAANSADFANCGSTTNLSSTGCRLALKFANQNNGSGEWLVAKNFYGRIVMPLIYVDSGFTPASSTSYADLNRFKDKNGAPLLASPNNIPVVNVSFPKEIEVWNLTIGGLAMEHGADGYLKNDNSSVGGIKISNSSPNLPATIGLQGSIGIYGF